MRIGIHQPEHLPWIGFFDRINKVDAFVILDHVNYKKNNYQNRNRIRNKAMNSWDWITIPIERSESRSIQCIQVVSKELWSRAYFEKIRHAYGKDTYYDDIITIVNDAIMSNSDSLSDINIKFIKETLGYLGITTPIFFSSKLQLTKRKSELIAEICEQIGGNEYVTGKGALAYLDVDCLKRRNISTVLRDCATAYQKLTLNATYLSIIDALVRQGPHIGAEIRSARVQEERIT